MEGTAITPAIATRRGAWPATKRAFDALAAAIGLMLLLPLLALIALAIKLDSRGPVIFRQARLGAGLDEFTVFKFRTMHPGQPEDAHREYIGRLARGEEPASGLKKLTKDPRVTRVGSLLRKTSLDELPQLANVLRGEMSLVGPRPAISYELEHYAERHFERFSVKPGITGLWQVSGRNRLGFLEMLDLDVEYAQTSGPAMDLKILVKTPVAAARTEAA
jgi:lipopolysaccharide/colanic/teichoic acid biosynthesis glycosyltransferase